MSSGEDKARRAYEEVQAEKRNRELVLEVTPVVEHAWETPFSTKSDFARQWASEVAAAACLGFISTSEKPVKSTVTPKQGVLHFGSMWRVTAAGAALLAKKNEVQ